MPGPKMGPRPPDFDEEVIKQSPTFVKWSRLADGEKLRYACRDFIKGYGDDEERLMRRIMIARRNNVKDHETLKKARKQQLQAQNQQKTEKDGDGGASNSGSAEQQRQRKPATTLLDQDVEKEMDVMAVESTRSYRAWAALPEGKEFCYNQKYIKGREGHDWLLRKNIWRRMRYRRENKKLLERVKYEGKDGTKLDDEASSEGGTSSKGHDNTHDSGTTPNVGIMMVKAEQDTPQETAAAMVAAAGHSDPLVADQAAIEAAVAAAESFVGGETSAGLHLSEVHNPLDVAAAQAALDAAAKLAAASSGHSLGSHHHHDDLGVHENIMQTDV